MTRKSGSNGSGGSGGGWEKDLEFYAVRIGVPALVLFFAVAGLGMALHKTPRQVWEAVTHPQAAASAVWRAAQGTRCAVSCPKKTALDDLSKLTVTPEANASTYRRAKFGLPWVDVDHNRCDTRDDILRRDLTNAVLRKTSTCFIGAPVSGTFVDPYSGATVTFNKAQAIKVQIDHAVSLGEAWRSGASAWTTAQRLAYANDPAVLVTTTEAINSAKSDYDAAKPWRECVKHSATGRCTGYQDDRPTGDLACTYAQHVVTIKTKYALTVDPSERDALRSDLEGCVS